MSNDQPAYFAYWGKASPAQDVSARYHLLAFHSLDVAACGQVLLGLPQFSLRPLAQALDWSLPMVERLCVFFLALHDLGKFARAFQGLVPELAPELVRNDAGKAYSRRHDTLGWLLWAEELAGAFPDDRLPVADDDFWAAWVRAVVGHHGQPPEEDQGGGLFGLPVADFFLREDCRAARAFVADLADWLLPDGIPEPGRRQCGVLRQHAWRLAGLAVLADWLGSSQASFAYVTQPRDLQDYWQSTALPQARQAVQGAGLQAQPIRHWQQPLQLFDYLQQPTPLQRYAADVALEAGPQLFLLEDVTGAGKTEAALILAQRLMQQGVAHGLYFALPSMATANQMYQRVGQVYRRLYDEQSQPSLILAHGARQLMDSFRQSILEAGGQPADRSYDPGDTSATAQCNAWLADNRKKALLAEVGVGTLDQALLAVLPVRHQSLRLLGLAGKVLLVDEVHAYDSYMTVLLKKLLTAHARQGGSVILLSATLPAKMREELLGAYRFGLDVARDDLPVERSYPLATQVGQRIASHACATRPQLVRQVRVSALHDEESVLALVAAQAAAGRCVCWIRNTVDDARRAFTALAQLVPAERLLLFHSRFAMGHRLDIEERALQLFGKHSSAAQRQGRVLIATQVVEQSLDLDFDAMVSDMAPIDLLIQRAGRLQRHARLADGSPAEDGIERRPAPLLHLLCPEVDEEPPADWYAALFPKACYVYPNIGQLWLGARALLRAGCIRSPGDIGQSGAVRELVEAVYGEDAEKIPEKLQKATQEQLGKCLAEESQAHFNALNLEKGYCIDSSARWYEDSRVPTRLGEESLTLYLARERDGELLPLLEGLANTWEQSAVRIDTRAAEALSSDWQQRFCAALHALRGRYRLLEEPAFVLPLIVDDGGRLLGKVVDEKGRELTLHYDPAQGLCW
ncbi:CRISPR-associated helicase/endonuclease Cas3 [Pseudomonas jinjuensis]|uniref:CRISPR-associated endonuclease/helicase Cas3 n=1 Tax=Pseudomonas jinjuensis TaxID=198616 RepID=A0A1H0ATS4_9PSED|nr:CRISPR-associated helicase/endonuclease Cas3 [Pseudomonas jinjuensis]SDN36877.1 CRISPR-associated endonuclease/helicase Cas3 [Pseudomonas jinjuensis]